MQQEQPVYIVLIAFGKRGYGFAAYNLAASIKKFNKNIFIHLLHDEQSTGQLTQKQLLAFDKLEVLKEDFINDAGKSKVSFYDYLIYDNALYLDVDALALHDVTNLFVYLSKLPGNIYTDVWGSGGYDDVIDYNLWAKNEDTYRIFNLDKSHDKINSVNTSFIFVKKCDDMKLFFDKLKENWSIFPLETLLHKWGKTMPDELIYMGTFAQFKINPDIGMNRPIFFGNKIVSDTFTKLIDKYYLLSIYGNDGGKKLTRLTYLEWYDRLVKSYNIDGYKFQYIMPDKHLNFR